MSDLPTPPPPPPPPPPPSFPPPPIPPPPPPGSPYGGWPAGPGVAAPQLAGVGKRFGAYVLDRLLTLACLVPAFLVLLLGPTELGECSVDAQGNIDVDGEFRALCDSPTDATTAAAILLGLAAALAFWAWNSARQGRTGQTLGKSATGIYVVDADTGAFVGFGRSFGRSLFALTLSGAICQLGFLWALWDRRKQTWHDKVVRSVVVVR